MRLCELLDILQIASNGLWLEDQVGFWRLIADGRRIISPSRLLFAEFHASLALDAKFDGEGVWLFLAVGCVAFRFSSYVWFDGKLLTIVKHALGF